MLILWSPLVLYAGAIFYFSSLPPERLLPKPIFGWDKLGHFFEYFFLGFLTARAFNPRSYNQRFLTAWLISCIYALSDEFHQSFIPGREASEWDWLADILGAGSGIYLFHRLKFKPRPNCFRR